MKKYTLFFLLLTSFVVPSIAQKTMVYCRMEVTGVVKSLGPHKIKRESIYIDLGSDTTSILNKNSTVTSQLKKLEDCNNGTDAMNYMSKLGWDLVYVVNFETGTYVCIYRKEFDN